VTDRALPRYPVYIPSKGRLKMCFTVHCLIKDGVPFYLVVEKEEFEAYSKEYGAKSGVTMLVLPESNQGIVYLRNWIKDHAMTLGVERHWQLDDNIRHFGRRWHGKRIRCDAGIALKVCEDFTDRYENIGVSGLNYYMFVPDRTHINPIQINCHVYSCNLYRSDAFRFRGHNNEDTDYCLQVIASGECTVLLNTFLIQKIKTMLVPGGNTAQNYQGDGRLNMARVLERRWPGVVSVERRFQRPQHVIGKQWMNFDTPLKLKPGIDLANLPPEEYGMELKAVDKVRSPRVRDYVDAWDKEHGKKPS